MNRAISLTLAFLAITAALPAAAHESSGLRLRNDPLATLDLIDANRGCSLCDRGHRPASRSTCRVSAGALDTIGFTRGVSLSVGAGSVAAQRIQNLSRWPVCGKAGARGALPVRNQLSRFRKAAH
jgi:hypothetical protein